MKPVASELVPLLRSARSLRSVRVLAAVVLASCGGGTADVTAPNLPTTVTITPPAPAIAFGALGRTAQLLVVVTGPTGAPIASPTVTWNLASGTAVSVSGTGLVTAAANGTSTVTATSGGVTSAPVTVTVAQVVASVGVTSTSGTPDTLFTATRTRQFTGTARDSTNNVMAGASLAWTTSAGGVATVHPTTGLVTSGATSGTSTIQAAAGAITGSRAMVVRHFPATFTIVPTVASITTNAGTQLFTGTSQDSVGTSLPLAWLSRAPGLASITPASGTTTTATGVANGTTSIVLTSGVRSDSAALTMTNQGPLPTTVTITPPAPPIVFGALGRTASLVVVVTGPTGAPVASPVVTWNVASGTAVSVSPAGLVTALANGTSTITATSDGVTSASVTVNVAQVVASVGVTSTSGTPDTLFTATRTRQFTGAARDSTNNVMAGATLAWTSTAGGVATVHPTTGLVTSGATSGSTTIQAAAGAITGTRTMVVRLYPSTFTLVPTIAAISVAAGTQLFTGTSQDSIGTNLPIDWLSRAPTLASISPASGTTTTATGVANGTTRIVMTSGVRSDSAALTLTNQGPTFPTAIAVTVGDVFFTSSRNLTSNPAVDTLAVGGTVTWTWVGGASHSVLSSGAPSFTSSTTKITGTYAFSFPAAGTFAYICGIHGAGMSGTVVVR